MDEVKHTPGPWEWWTSCSWKRLTSKDENGKWLREGNVLCPSIASDGHPILDVSEEDMSLIAAAPKMLSDLIEAEKMFRWYGDLHAAKPDAAKAMRNYAMADRLADTIAKAEGRS